VFKNYFVAVIILTPIVLITLISLTLHFQYTFAGEDEFNLINYQTNKIDSREPADIIFLGDSSLGHAINAEVFSQLSGQSTKNYALFESTGFASDYGFLLRRIRVSKPKTAIFMHTLSTFSRPVNDIGFPLTAEFPVDWFSLSFNRYPGVFSSLVKMIRSLRFEQFYKAIKGERRDQVRQLEHDYVRQTRQFNINGVDPMMFANSQVNSQKLVYLKLISDLCLGYSVKCIFSIGPNSEAIFNHSKTFLKAIAKSFVFEGLSYHEFNPILSDQQVGDGFDHVAGFHKDRMTHIFYNNIKALLPPF